MSVIKQQNWEFKKPGGHAASKTAPGNICKEENLVVLLKFLI